MKFGIETRIILGNLEALLIISFIFFKKQIIHTSKARFLTTLKTKFLMRCYG